jgi:uncharacterized membrane protein YfcA
MPNDNRREWDGFFIAVGIMIPVALVMFLPPFLWLPVYLDWRLLTWVAAVLGPLCGARLGERVARRLDRPVRAEWLQNAVNTSAVTLFLISVLPLIPPDRT